MRPSGSGSLCCRWQYTPPARARCGRLWIAAAISLALFRFFDIVKPLGVRRMEALPSGWGVMADDILAGIYGGILMLIINTWLL